MPDIQLRSFSDLKGVAKEFINLPLLLIIETSLRKGHKVTVGKEILTRDTLPELRNFIKEVMKAKEARG